LDMRAQRPDMAYGRQRHERDGIADFFIGDRDTKFHTAGQHLFRETDVGNSLIAYADGNSGRGRDLKMRKVPVT